MKVLFISIILMIHLPSWADSASIGFLKAGSYIGKHNGKEKATLMLRPVEGRQGSFLAVLMKTEKKISLYLVDYLNSSSYSMTPLEVTRYGNIGVINDDPSLVISGALDKDKRMIFKIMSANSGNNVGFDGFLEFNGKKSNYKWLNLVGGQYELNGAKNALQISEIDVIEGEATAVFLTPDISGTFKLREKKSGMYLINQEATFATGTKVSQMPRAISIFVEKNGVFGDSRKMISIDPKNDENLLEYILLD